VRGIEPSAARCDARAAGLWQRVARNAGGALSCLRDAHARHGVGYARLGARLLDLYVRRAYSLAEVRAQDLLHPGVTPATLDARQSKQAQLELQRMLNPAPYWALTEDKRVFDIFCRGAGLPVPVTFGTIRFDRSTKDAMRIARSRDEAVAVLRSALPVDLIVKPSDGVYGRGVRGLRRRGERFLCSDAVERGPDEVVQWIEQDREFDAFVVQQHLKAHASIALLSGSDNLSTVRMVTYVARGGRVVVGCCQLRVIAGDAIADNYCNGRSGNLIADIPDAAGRLSRVFGPSPSGTGMVEHAAHPATGVRFAGFELPYWREALDLVERAARAMLPMRTIGWDVGITDAGPVLIEGNASWDPAYEGDVGGEILRAVRADERGALAPVAAARIPAAGEVAMHD
jgi:hypothetical protein